MLFWKRLLRHSLFFHLTCDDISMLNISAILFIEASSGKKMSSLMADKADVSERTLRNFPFSKKTCQKLLDGSESDFKNSLKVSGYDSEEIKKITSNHPKSLYAGIIYEYQVQASADIEFPLTLDAAKKIDSYSLVLHNLFQKDDIEGFKNVLLSSEFGNSQYFEEPDFEGKNYSKNIRLCNEAKCWKDIDIAMRAVSSNCLFSLMAIWDLEFFSLYATKYKTRSLFSLLLPKIDPLAEYSMDLGIKKRRGMFWLPTKRLIELISCFGWCEKNKTFPDEVPKVSDGFFWGDETEQNLVNWRDGTKRFLYKDFIRVWDINGKNLAMPSPLYVAAKMWEISLVRIKTNEKKIIIADDWYQFWWDKQHEKLASDLNLTDKGKENWPKCFGMI